MTKAIVALGVFALLFALADVVHGQHNGDLIRSHIHIAEFISFLAFLALLETQAFRLMLSKSGLNRWVAAIVLSVASILTGFVLFAVSGRSAHGDGGPISAVFGIMGIVGAIGLPIAVIGFLISALNR